MWWIYLYFRMTSSNGIIFRVIGLCAWNSPATGEFPAQRPVTRGFDVFFDLRLNKRLRKQSKRRWFETPSRSLWRHCNVPGLLHWQVAYCQWIKTEVYGQNRPVSKHSKSHKARLICLILGGQCTSELIVLSNGLALALMTSRQRKALRITGLS